MDIEETIDEMSESMPIRWGCAVPGLRIGGDSVLDIALTVDAVAAWAEFGGGSSPPYPGVGNVNGLRNATIRFYVPPYVSVTPLSLLEGERLRWVLPDLSWNERVHIAFRITLQVDRLPTDDLFVLLARVRLTADSITEDGADISTVVFSQELSLPLLGGEEWLATPGDPVAAESINLLTGKPALVEGRGSVDDVAT